MPADVFEFAAFELEAVLFLEAAVFDPFVDVDPLGSMDEATSFRNVLAPVFSPVAAGLEIAETASETASAAVERIPLLGCFLDFDPVEDDFVPVLFLALVAPDDFVADLAPDV